MGKTKKKQKTSKKVRKLAKAFNIKMGVDPSPQRKGPKTLKKTTIKVPKVAKKTETKRSQEDREFQAEQQSLFERESIITWKRNQSKRGNKAIEFEPSVLKPRGTNDLVEETTKQIDGLVGYGLSGLQQSQIPSESNKQPTSKNPFAPLEEKEPKASPFNFAPPSFQLGNQMDDHDPDL